MFIFDTIIILLKSPLFHSGDFSKKKIQKKIGKIFKIISLPKNKNLKYYYLSPIYFFVQLGGAISPIHTFIDIFGLYYLHQQVVKKNYQNLKYYFFVFARLFKNFQPIIFRDSFGPIKNELFLKERHFLCVSK
jgi:hypothetical protein